MLIVLAIAGAGGCDRATNDAPEAGKVSAPPADRPSVRASESSPALPAAGAIPKAAARPNVVLVVACTFRYDHLSSAGYARPTTPFLDSLAGGGVFFESAVGASSWTQPSVASIMTGLTANVHRMYDRARIERLRDQRYVLPDELVTVGESLSDAGYATFYRANNIHGGVEYGIPQGFDNVVTASVPDTVTPRMLADFEDWLGTQPGERPVFAMFLAADAHYPHHATYEHFRRFSRTAPPVSESDYEAHRKEVIAAVKIHRDATVPNDVRDAFVDLYDASLNQLDASLSRIPDILSGAGRGDNTVIIVTGDHGERFFEHGRWFHGADLDEELIHVPLIMFGPGIPAGTRFGGVVRTIDVYPTIAALAGAAVPEVVQGVNLLPLVNGSTTAELSAYSACSDHKNEFVSVRIGDYKLHGDGRLFNLATDPGEMNDVAAALPEVVQRLSTELDRWRADEVRLQAVVPTSLVDLDDESETIRKLKGLGYIDD